MQRSLLIYLPFFAGAGLLIFSIDLHRVTFIATPISVGLFFLSGLFGFILIRKNLKKAPKHKFQTLTSVVYCLVTFGGILPIILLAGNFYIADQSVQSETFPIIRSGSFDSRTRSKCPRPFVEIERNGIRKDIILNCKIPKPIEAYKSIDHDVSPGAFGFDIIRNKRLNE